MNINSVDAYSYSADLTSSVRNALTVAPISGVQGQLAEDAVDQNSVKAAVSQINEFIAPIKQSIQFSTDTDSGRVVVKVVDSETQKVLRQIPNEEVLAISKALGKLQGLIIKETA